MGLKGFQARRRAFGNVRRGTYVGRRYNVVPPAESGPSRRRWRVDNRITRALPPLPCPTLLAMPTVPKSLRKEKRKRRGQRRSRSCVIYLGNYINAVRKQWYIDVELVARRDSLLFEIAFHATDFRENRDKNDICLPFR